jgi:Zn-dependent M28 family amino/carboxypeptidase
VRLVLFDAEERGLRGSTAFLADRVALPADIAAVVNLDMVSRSTERKLVAAGARRSSVLRAAVVAAQTRSSLRLVLGHDRPLGLAGEDWTDSSDQGPFAAAGVPWLYFGVEDHEDYHRPTDTPERIDRAFFVESAETILDALVALDATLP